MTRGPSISDDTASLLLATKSNYQNILEGTHLPGISYPTELSTNLTSKRTSHKIAEQGRRNRINSALQEIATLLPGSAAAGSGSGDAEGGEGEKGGGKNQQQSSSSKASTVEHAIEYIKALRGEVEEATRRAERAEKALAEQQGAGAMET
ncbi:nuclease [Pseudogymnoascus destructans]|uniref:Nuclease n=1 Tax=Pseudogymnoascus destructans TaxID=655981 RepID=A0A177A989_9PEZI|nr:nuclease [Pseudogymnoascus destructans]OAF58687.1 nuclease [Pseudogymnoascus destructans]